MAAADSTDRALPTGRYNGFEDDGDDASDMRSLLGERPGGRRDRTRRPATQTTPDTAEAVPGPGAAPVATTKTTTAPPATTSAPPAPGRMRSSSMHIRSALVEQIITEREKTGRSNGAIIIAALEAAHPQLGQLLGPVAEPAGGGLFAARPTHAPRTVEGPYSPLNVRLFEADFTVLDQLVATFGARSRSHLVDTALHHYFH